MAQASFDVAVVGGGSAGLAAAVSAARIGSRTLLVERSDLLGGNASLAYVHTICGLFAPADAGDANWIHPGFPRRFALGLRDAGAAAAPERAGRVHVLPVWPPRLAAYADRLCAATPGLEVWKHTELVGAAIPQEDSGCATLRLRTPAGGEIAVGAQVVIDATGDASVAALGGAECVAASPTELQIPSFIFRMEGVDTSELAGFARLRVTHAIAGAVRSGALPAGCDSVLVRRGEAPDEVYLTLNLPRPTDPPYAPLDPACLAELERRARRGALQVAGYLRETRPAFGKCRILAWPQRVGVRETRRLQGLACVTREDVLEGRVRDDEVALSSWPIELWSDHRRARFEYPDAPCSVPLGALVSRSHPRLGAAGRCLSASHEALGALRVIGTALATGEAVGVAAALAADARSALTEIAAQDVRHHILRLAETGGARLNVVDLIRRQASERPSHPAVVVDTGQDGARVVDYAELVGSFDAHAKRLRAEGVGPGDRCGLLAPQGASFVELALGILAARGCLAPIPDDHRGAVLDEFLARSRLHHLVRSEESGFERSSCPEAAPVDGEDDRAFRALDPAYLRFTSGTTSRRKGVLLGHATVLARLDAANRALAIGPEDRVLWLLPMAHHFVVSILLYLSRGATLLLPASSLAKPVLALAGRERATVLYASPHHYGLLGGDTTPQQLPQVRLAVSTADGLRADVAKRFRERFGFPVTQALGIIEVGLPVANLEAAESKPEALGRPLPDYEIWLRSEDGAAIEAPSSPERTGEILIRGPGLLDAYLDPWTPADEILEEGAFCTGDQGWFDADGDLYLAGRRANRISMAGMKFFSEEVEAVIDAHPAVRESRVRARAHAHLGEIPVAEIVPTDPDAPPERRALTAHCRERLPTYKIPREFRVVDALPHTSSGKLQRSMPA